jgi:MipA family protein
MFPSRRLRAGLLVSLSCMALTARAQDAAIPAPVPEERAAGSQLPLWELGIAGAGGLVPDYPASDHENWRAVPYPFFIYRGTLFRSDENGARLRAAHTSNFELDVSGDASFAAREESTGARAGMPKLDDLFELGPNLKITLARPAPHTRLLLELPVRGIASVNGIRFAYRGLIFAPGVGPWAQNLFGTRWSGYSEVGLEFASQRLQDYYYSVYPQYAEPGRPAYAAHGGYLGSRIELGLSHPIGRSLRFFFYERMGYYNGAESADSPLFRAHVDNLVFAGLDWAFLKSKETVEQAAEQ